MTGQMCWLSKFGGNGELILHLRLEPYHPWKPYTHFTGLAIPDHPIPGCSRLQRPKNFWQQAGSYSLLLKSKPLLIRPRQLET
jgi:hypothetical protein